MRERVRHPRRLVWSIIVILVLLAFGGGAYLEWGRPKAALVQTTAVRVQNLKNIIFASGTVKPNNRQVINTTQLPGPIQQIKVTVGEHVTSGQELLQCQDQSQLADLHEAEQQKADAEQVYDALKARIKANASLGNVLSGGNVNSVNNQVSSAVQAQLNATLQSQLQAAKASLDQANAAVHKAQLAIAATKITSQLTGTVIIVNPNGIQPDGSSGPVIEVVGGGKQVVADLSEVDAVNVHKGQDVTVTSQAFPGKTWTGKVVQVNPFATSTNGSTGQVEIAIGKLSDKWPVPLGYQVDLHIVSQIHQHATVVPYSALVQQGTDYAVFVLKGHQVHEKSVTLGITENTVVEVQKGLKVGDKVVVNPPQDLKSGQVVRLH